MHIFLNIQFNLLFAPIYAIIVVRLINLFSTKNEMRGIYMTENNFKLLLPEGLVGEYKIHDVLNHPSISDAKVLTLIHDMSADGVGHVVRVYMSRKENDGLIFDFELEAFAFPSHDSAVAFANRLPSLTALELLMVQNGYDFELMEGKPRILQ